jgi:hypothetical protein
MVDFVKTMIIIVHLIMEFTRSGDEGNDDGSRYGGPRHGPYSNGGIEVQILPQNDDRWDAATAITDATSAYTGQIEALLQISSLCSSASKFINLNI